MVYYSDPRDSRGVLRALQHIRDAEPDLYYFNSLWARYYTLIPLILIALHLLPRAPIVLAPRGEVLMGALRSKPRRKQLGTVALRRFLRFLNVTMHVTSTEERDAVAARFPGRPMIEQQDLFIPCGVTHRPQRRSDQFQLLYLSRVHPHKNLLTAIRAASQVTNPLHLRVVGSTGDDAYMQQCVRAIEQGPRNVQVQFAGHVDHREVSSLFATSDVFILPTKSENFGHAIREALCHGCIPLVSESTPWTDLIRSVGLPTPRWNDVEGFAQALQALTSLTRDELEDLRRHVVAAYLAWEEENCGAREQMCDELLQVAAQNGR